MLCAFLAWGCPQLAMAQAAGAELSQLQVERAGDAVLLSPACASFDMFRDYPHRAQVFCQAVADIAQAAGHPMESVL